ncbi:uncharacterized protein LY89DRAFT_679117 [Mollisia scopiformis]|uniref:Uncharacterized protein n=1 Tax=Mollisia scopiformis TaxID=149040 RepID=A0A194XVR1_MOLSC|nr:uncharacterized protein LY89DRAFT_679117 [Mollisia scopiformis]KUJ23802.1 hypothetical protein LY89DRAFT_679117 [Mollisia scopiformis]
MPPAIFPFLELPTEIRIQIYQYSFAIREPAFQYHYHARHGCHHNNLSRRSFYALGSGSDETDVKIRDLTYTSCPRRTRLPASGFLALRLVSRQIYEETYSFIRLPLISLKTHHFEVNELSIDSFLSQLEKAWLRDHVKELVIDFYPVCKHSSNPELLKPKRTCFNVFANFFDLLIQTLWRGSNGTKQQLCSADHGATIQPLAELLASFPLLEAFKVNVFDVCPLDYSLAVAGDQEVLAVLRSRGVKVDFESSSA